MCKSSDSKLERIGFMMHWGVGSYPYYHRLWDSHRAPNASDNSQVNIKNAFDEFQRRSAGSDGRVLFVFLSNFWDFRAHLDHFETTKPFSVFRHEYRLNMTDVVSQLVERLRPNDEMVLQTSHVPSVEFSSYAYAVNLEIRKVADTLKLRILDAERAVGSADCAAGYLFDLTHQNVAASSRIIDEIYKLLPPPPTTATPPSREACAAFAAADSAPIAATGGVSS